MDLQNIFDFGADAGRSFVNTGNPAQILQFLDDAHSVDQNRRLTGSIACYGVFTSFASTLDGAKKAGARFSNPVPTMAEFNYAYSCGSAAYSAVAQRLYDAIVALRRGAPGVTVGEGKPTQKISVQTIERDPVSQEITRITTV